MYHIPNPRQQKCFDRSLPSQIFAAVGAHVEDNDAVVTPYIHPAHRLTATHTHTYILNIHQYESTCMCADIKRTTST